MKRSIAAAVAAVALTAAFPAVAADFILTDDLLIDSSPCCTFSNFSITGTSPGTVTAQLGNTVGATTFLDRYIFAPTFMGTGSGSAVTNFQAGLSFGTPGLRIDGYTLTAPIAAALADAFTTGDSGSYQADVATVAGFLASASAVYTQLGIPSGLDRQLFNVPLDTANFYVISIDGTGSRADSRYDGNLSANQTAVPEPATWAMMLVGFGLIGFAMRRQRQSHPKVRFAF